MSNIAMIIAGGRGVRAHQSIPKQFIKILDKPIIVYTMEAFQRHPGIDAIEVVCLEGWQDTLLSYAQQYGITKLESIVNGGDTGHESIRNGLEDISKRYDDDDDIVIIHDANRPMVSGDIISDNIRVCRKYGNATAVIPCTSAVLKVDKEELSDEQIPRDSLEITQTPQSFFVKELLNTHIEAEKRNLPPSVASCTLYVEMGKKVYLSVGSKMNIKLTTPVDLEIFKALVKIAGK